jgi:RHS repeat-associated protein
MRAGVSGGSLVVGRAAGPRRLLAGLLLALAAVAALTIAPAVASAEPLCTDTWTGPSAGNWNTAEDWSAGVPTSSSVACIGTGKTVSITEGLAQAAVLDDKGGLWAERGTLELTDTLEASSVSVLTLKSRATLAGSGSLDVAESLTCDEASLSGTGSFVIEVGASADLYDKVALSDGKLVNEGTITLMPESDGGIEMFEGTEVRNAGTFNANTDTGGVGVSEPTAEPRFVNTGIVQTSLIERHDAKLGVHFDNEGVVNAKAGELIFDKSVESHGPNSWRSEGGEILFREAAIALTGGEWSGKLVFVDANGTLESINASAAQVEMSFATLSVALGSTVSIGKFFIGSTFSRLAGAGTVAITKEFRWSYATVGGGFGSLIVLPGATGTIEGGPTIENYKLVNEGTITTTAAMEMREGSTIENDGTLIFASSVGGIDGPTVEPTPPPNIGVITNNGLFETTSSGTTNINAIFINRAEVAETPEDHFHFDYPDNGPPEEQWGEENPSAPERELPMCGESVSCNGNFTQSQTDFAIGGRGVGLDLTRTYNAQAAAAGVHGGFGYGWSASFSDHLVLEPASHLATLVQADGSSVAFAEGSGETFTAPAWSQDMLSGSASLGYKLTLEDQTVYRFSGAGRLESVTDRNGNATTLAYNGAGELETITDPAGRKIKLAYNSEGLVESVEDPMKHVVKYTYEGGNLMTVTQPGESALRWQFKYESHKLTEMIDGRGGKTLVKYSGSQVSEEVDPMSRATTFEYQSFATKTTNHATGAVTMQYLTSSGMGSALTKGYGTSLATTERSTYNAADELLTSTDGDGHTTKYTYENGNRTSMVDPDGDETKWTYDATHDIHTTTTPDGETTTTERNSDGDPETVSRPAPGSATQVTKYAYDAHGDETSMENPLKQVWKYEYDSAGDRAAEIDPEGDKRTWGYNEDSQETSMVSPRGHVEGAKESSFTTTTERDAQGRPVKVIAPLKHETTYKYDGDGNVESETDPQGHTTTYTYDADNERTKVEEPNETVTETGYDGAGQVVSQTDGDKHTTKYERNVLEQVTEVVDPLGRKTLKEYDKAGNLTSVVDAEKRTTTYKYDPDNRLTEITYSDGKTPDVKYEYNKDGDRTKMIDGTGTTSYEYDQLDRLTATKDGHGATGAYEYNVGNEQTGITYPNGKAVTREYDNAGRLKSVTDWEGHKTKFAYDADSNLAATTFPSGTSDEDAYAYNEADAMSEVKMKKGAETLGSIDYTRNSDERITKAAGTGATTGEPSYAYDANGRMTKGGFGSTFEYDAANNPTTIYVLYHYAYNAADELESRSLLGKSTVGTYSYNEVGERTQTTTTTGPTTTYGYDQAGNLVSVSRPKEGETTEINDTYAYNGDGLRASQTIGATTSYLTWDTAEQLPLILNDGTNSYIYGPGGLPVEQIASSGGAILYLHHDQQGSTRLITGETGKDEGAYSYTPNGGVESHSGTATTPLGYDGQYTSADTGLIYMRAREYDPATAQFLSVDPKVEETNAVYEYAKDDPLDIGDPTGLEPWSPKIKRAQAKCQSWKAWRSKKSPFYGNRSIYQACLDLLSLPSQVYGTGGQGGGTITTGEKVGAVCSASGPGVALVTRGISGGPEVAGGVATFCFGYTAGELIVDPILHGIAPSVFAE